MSSSKFSHERARRGAMIDHVLADDGSLASAIVWPTPRLVLTTQVPPASNSIITKRRNAAISFEMDNNGEVKAAIVEDAGRYPSALKPSP